MLNFQKLEAELSSIKSYIKCEMSDLTQKIDSATQNVYETLKDIEQRVKNTEILNDHLLLLQNKLSSKNETTKSVMDAQSPALNSQPPFKHQLIDFKYTQRIAKPTVWRTKKS